LILLHSGQPKPFRRRPGPTSASPSSAHTYRLYIFKERFAGSRSSTSLRSPRRCTCSREARLSTASTLPSTVICFRISLPTPQTLTSLGFPVPRPLRPTSAPQCWGTNNAICIRRRQASLSYIYIKPQKALFIRHLRAPQRSHQPPPRSVFSHTAHEEIRSDHARSIWGQARHTP